MTACDDFRHGVPTKSPYGIVRNNFGASKTTPLHLLFRQRHIPHAHTHRR